MLFMSSAVCMWTSRLCMERDGRSTMAFAFMTIRRQSDRCSVIKVKKSDHCYQTHCVYNFISCSRYSGEKLFLLLLHCAMLDSSVWKKYSSVSKQLWWKQVNFWSTYIYILLGCCCCCFFFSKRELSSVSHRLFWAVIFGLIKRTRSSILCKPSYVFSEEEFLFKIPHNPRLALISFRGSGLTKGRISCITNTFQIDF